MDAERVAALAIQGATGIPCRLDVPAERPDEFVTVSLSATSADRFSRRVRLTAQSWAGSRKRAHEIAEAVEAACAAVEDDPNVLSCLPDGTYRWDDPETGTPRYQTNINMSICE